jgi:hypothetical protein
VTASVPEWAGCARERELAPESKRADIHELITLFDGPLQREAKRLSVEALGEADERAT